MGSRLNLDLAYIAGFLDGDGSIMLQVKSRNDTSRGVRFMATLCLYQETRHAQPLRWMRTVFNIGYLSDRKDGITELRINGFASVRRVLELLRPYIRFKVAQAEAMIAACALLEQKPIRNLSEKELLYIVDMMFIIKDHNYKSTSTHTKEAVLHRLGLTP